MKERPILMSAENVNATLEKRKTQTRRLNGLEDVNHYPGKLIGNSPLGPLGYRGLELSDYYLKSTYKRQFKKDLELFHWFLGMSKDEKEINPIPIKCPYGKPGDLLWVRETWRIVGWHEGEPYLLEYKADGTQLEEPGDSSNYDDEKYIQYGIDSSDDCSMAKIPIDEDGIYRVFDIGIPTRWRPSIFMPRWASRITLKITNVRVERLQNISAQDCMAEGIYSKIATPLHIYEIGKTVGQLKSDFWKLWDSINAKRGYPLKNNPWVWVIDYRIFEGEVRI